MGKVNMTLTIENRNTTAFLAGIWATHDLTRRGYEFIFVMGHRGLEPLTSSMSTRRASQLR